MITLKLHMKNFFFFSIILFFSACSADQKKTELNNDEDLEKEELKTESEEAAKPLSPRMEAKGKIGEVNITIDYGSPSVRNRKIWGGLEEYGKVWRAGANETTNIEFDKDVMVGNTAIAAGKYGFFIIPNKEGDWVIIFNTQWSQEEHGMWGAYNYDESHDVARSNISPVWGDELTERLEYKIENQSIKFRWEKVSLSIPVSPAN